MDTQCFNVELELTAKLAVSIFIYTVYEIPVIWNRHDFWVGSNHVGFFTVNFITTLSIVKIQNEILIITIQISLFFGGWRSLSSTILLNQLEEIIGS